MDKLIEYKIPYKRLSEGEFLYDFEVDGKFFEAFESDELKSGQVKVNLALDKQSRMMVLDFAIEGSVVVDCDRCGYELSIAIMSNKKIIVKYTDDGSDSDDIVILNEKDPNLDVSEMIFEFIVLSLPMRRVHPKGQCNEEQLKMLKNLSKPSMVDSPWEALKNIKLDDN